MDTRAKIIDAARAAQLASEGAILVSGHFDPLVASHAQRLAELRAGLAKDSAPLLVLIDSPGRPILPPRARAELVASLRVVDYVAEMSEALNGVLTPHMRLEKEHDERFEVLVAHVRARQNA